ncbi:MAG: hypothetical protein FWC42_09755 [Proteobacteria bacterium]|nr:hypothetical protein [Pseudomonadota bacterium]
MKWKAGQNNQSTWLQYLSDNESFAVLSFMRRKGVRRVEILLQEIPDELKSGSERMCPFSLQDYNGDEYISVEGLGFLKDNTVGQRVFTTGWSAYDDDLQPFRNVIEKIRNKFVLEIDGDDRIFEIDDQNIRYLKEIFSDNEPVF